MLSDGPHTTDKTDVGQNKADKGPFGSIRFAIFFARACGPRFLFSFFPVCLAPLADYWLSAGGRGAAAFLTATSVEATPHVGQPKAGL